MISKTRTTETIPSVKTVIVTPDLPNAIDYIVLNNGTCIISHQCSKRLGGQTHD